MIPSFVDFKNFQMISNLLTFLIAFKISTPNMTSSLRHHDDASWADGKWVRMSSVHLPIL